MFESVEVLSLLNYLLGDGFQDSDTCYRGSLHVSVSWKEKTEMFILTYGRTRGLLVLSDEQFCCEMIHSPFITLMIFTELCICVFFLDKTALTF